MSFKMEPNLLKKICAPKIKTEWLALNKIGGPS